MAGLKFIAAAGRFARPPLLFSRERFGPFLLAGTVTEFWFVAALVITGIIIGALILAALGIAYEQRPDRREGEGEGPVD